MAKTYAIVIGVVLLLVGVLGWIFKDQFSGIPTYHLVVDILAGLWGVYVGFMGEKKTAGSGSM